MRAKKIISLTFLALFSMLLSFGIYCFVVVKQSGVLQLENCSFVTLEDINQINDQKLFGQGISAALEKDEVAAGQEHISTGNIIFRLFGLFKIKSIDVNIVSSDDVFVGGQPLGFSLQTQGVIVVGNTCVLTENGAQYAIEEGTLEAGDLIFKVDDEKVQDVAWLCDYVNVQGGLGNTVNLSVKRKNKVFNVVATPLLDSQSNEYKLGLWIRDDASGIGTLTYVDKNMNFGALGHPVADAETGAKISVQDGKVYDCSLIGVDKGQKGVPGRLKGVFLESKKTKGLVEKSTEFGIFGKIEDSSLIDVNRKAKVGSRLVVQTGKAKIISCVSGVAEEYDVEIIKASKQSKAGDKSMVIKVTDKRLLQLTGGIVQGMSGCPIIQDGKIVGAVTHVFVSDPTKGYGVYIDWMMAA